MTSCPRYWCLIKNIHISFYQKSLKMPLYPTPPKNTKKPEKTRKMQFFSNQNSRNNLNPFTLYLEKLAPHPPYPPLFWYSLPLPPGFRVVLVLDFWLWVLLSSLLNNLLIVIKSAKISTFLDPFSGSFFTLFSNVV